MAGQRDGRRNALAIERRRVRVVELRDEGMGFREIAAELGVSVALVHRDYEAALAKVPVKSVEQYREHQMIELAKLREIVQDVVDRRHQVVSDGRPVFDEDGPMLDDAPLLAAVDRLMKINDREAKLLGLDARPEVQVTGDLTYRIVGLGLDDPSGKTDAIEGS